MTRRRFYAPQIAFASDGKSVTLSADEARHARDVLRLTRGDEVFVFDGEGKEYRCVISELTAQSAAIQVIEQVEPTKPESPLDLTLAVALLKSEKFDLVVQKATELGVTRFAPVITARADVRIREPQDAKRKLERWQRIAFESAKQCGRASLMNVDAPKHFEEFCETISDVQLKVMYTARDGGSSAEVFKSDAKIGGIVAMIGPEGGWTDEEIEKACVCGWHLVTLGGRILRAETAAITVAALLQHQFGDLA